MSEIACWPEATLSEIRHMRRAGKSWPEIGETLQVCPDAARRQGYKMNLPRIRAQKRVGPLPSRPRVVAETQPVQRKPEQLADARPTLPPGATWALLTAGTCLDGQPYPGLIVRSRMIESFPDLAFLTLSYVHHHGGGMTDWIAHMAISSVIHAVIYGFVFRLMGHLTLQQDALLVAVVLGVAFLWARSRDRRGW